MTNPILLLLAGLLDFVIIHGLWIYGLITWFGNGDVTNGILMILLGEIWMATSVLGRIYLILKTNE